MSSAISTDESRLQPTTAPRGDDQGIRPWQFFLLAGMLSATVVVLLVRGQSPASIIVLSVTVVSASLVALGAYRAFAPLVVPESVEVPQLIVGRTRAALEREKTLVLRSIKELDFDYAMGKIAKSDFDELSSRLRARAIGLMRQLDEAGGYRQQIERELQARVKTASPPDSPTIAGDLSAGPQMHVESGEVSAEAVDLTVCQCGTSNDPDARFCKNCGSKLAAA